MNLHKIHEPEEDQLLRFMRWRFPDSYLFRYEGTELQWRMRTDQERWERVLDPGYWARTMRQHIAHGDFA